MVVEDYLNCTIRKTEQDSMLGAEPFLNINHLVGAVVRVVNHIHVDVHMAHIRLFLNRRVGVAVTDISIVVFVIVVFVLEEVVAEVFQECYFFFVGQQGSGRGRVFHE